MSEDRAKEIIAEKVAKEVVESIGEDMAGALVEYANLVKDLAAEPYRRTVSRFQLY